MITLVLGAMQAALAEPPEIPSPAEPLATQPAPRGSDPEILLREIRALREEVAALRREQAPEASDLGAPARVVFSEAVTVSEGERVREVVSFGDDVRVAGDVDGDAISFGGNVKIERTGRVGGDAVSFGGVVEVDEGGALAGNRVAMGMPTALPVAEHTADEPVGMSNLRLATDTSELMRSMYRRLVWMLSIAGAGVLVVGLFPARVSRVASDIEARPVRSVVVGTLATGFLSLFAALFVVVTLGLGSPVSLLLLALLAMAWLLGFVGLCQAVGDRLPVQERPHGRWIAFLVGVVLVTFLGSLPWVGWLVVGGASMLGVGSALSTRFGRA